MASLLNLSNLSQDRVLLVDGNGMSVSASCLQGVSSENSGFFKNAANKNIAILLSDRSHTARLLPLLDGLCARLFIVPRELQSDALSQLLLQMEADFLVTDQEFDGLELKVEVVKLIYPSDSKPFIIQAPKQPVATEWVIATSGTTGLPKLVVHTLAELSGSLKKDQARGGEFVWGLLYDLSKYAGLQVYLQALLGGSTLLIPASEMALDQQIDYFAKNQCNALSATPTLWRKILMSPASHSLKLKRITLGGEIKDLLG